AAKTDHGFGSVDRGGDRLATTRASFPGGKPSANGRLARARDVARGAGFLASLVGNIVARPRSGVSLTATAASRSCGDAVFRSSRATASCWKGPRALANRL